VGQNRKSAGSLDAGKYHRRSGENRRREYTDGSYWFKKKKGLLGRDALQSLQRTLIEKRWYPSSKEKFQKAEESRNHLAREGGKNGPSLHSEVRA